ncbi:HIT family protein [Aeromonas hydrophila]|uniref:HIT domain-containing protein n=1 Tax=Aeromonas hydrophila TaxID=644 RepID=A0AAX3P1K5_AERHY|nr:MULTISPECIES: HIT domain-containing protein [Aeromonas]GKQ63358.1 histidine triad protein [Aeromonas caviae]HDT5862246.1 HIT domain-containing protein [Aeromonas hydrophila subsp. hydrophila]MCO4116920.1 HIT domain-containing protein [Aeromonas hydrophila]MCV9384163.1 HIT domain-containing protein [Aeromonas hydrophila]MDD9225302.1 HIT domain-containing protein [Aeromonas hydrophila]
MFELHSRLQADTRLLGDLPLCRVLLAKDSQYPWLILVPRVANLREIHHLAPAQQQQLMEESCAVATLMEQALRPDKINVAALGNLVPQLHLHHVARFSTDKAWPGPIWGAHPSVPYEEAALLAEVASWRLKLANLAGFSPLGTDN